MDEIERMSDARFPPSAPATAGRWAERGDDRSSCTAARINERGDPKRLGTSRMLDRPGPVEKRRRRSASRHFSA